MKLKYILISIITFILIIPNVYAKTCDKSDMISKKKLANEMTIVPSLVKDADGNDTGKYNLSIEGIIEEFYIIDVTTGEKYDYYMTDNGTLTIKNLDSGTYKFKVYYDVCAEEYLKTISYRLPKYNHYANDPLCEGITSDQLDVCGKFYEGNLDYDTLKQKVEDYKATLLAEEEKKAEEEPLSNKIFEFLKEYYFYIIAAIAIIVVITVAIVINKRRGALE